jgi:hypothetical protein
MVRKPKKIGSLVRKNLRKVGVGRPLFRKELNMRKGMAVIMDEVFGRNLQEGISNSMTLQENKAITKMRGPMFDDVKKAADGRKSGWRGIVRVALAGRKARKRLKNIKEISDFNEAQARAFEKALARRKLR